PRSRRVTQARGARASGGPPAPRVEAQPAPPRTQAGLPRTEPSVADRPDRLRRVSEKRYLFTPGPTPVPPEVLAAMAEPMVHHRGPDFRLVYERSLARLQEVYRTKSPVLLFAASGTGAMDSAVANLATAGQRVAVVTAGAFGERWVAICEQYGLEVERIAYEWGET